MSTGKRMKNQDNKRTLNKLRIIFLIIALAFLVISIRFYSSIMNMNMLPTKYVTILTIVIALITIALIIGTVKKHKTLKLNIFCTIIIIVISAGYIFANNYVDITMKFLNNILTEVNEVEEYYVVVRKESNYNKLDDIKNKELYTFQIEDDIKQKIQGKVAITIKEEDNLTNLGNDLLSRKIDIVAISSSQYNMLGEEIENFKDKTRILTKETHKIENIATIEDTTSKYTIGTGVFNIYISGIDTYGNINNVSRSDSNTIVTVNLNTHEILLTSIPRDYYVTLHSKKAKDKLTHSGIYGITETVTTVEDFLGIDINYYVRVNFTTLIKIIDTLGGIDVYSDYSFSRDGYNFQKGYNHLSGNAALTFSRERYSFAGGDNQRIKNQQKVIEAIMNKALSSKTILTKYTDILNSLSGSFNTNIDQNEISKIVKNQLDTMPKWKIKTISLTGTGANNTTYSMGKQLLYVMNPNQSSINEAKTAIKSVMKE